MFTIPDTYRRCIGHYAEYPGAYAWPEYEYKCPECGKWHKGSYTTQILTEETEAYLCTECEKKIDF